MDFIEQVQVLSSRVSTIKGMIQTEEATKNAMIMPFIQMLGYDPFNPLEVTPELVADIGSKKGEKVDYAILKDGKPIMIFECKKSDADLNISHAGQLFRYFHVTESRFGVLTNGLSYQFFTDLDNPNKMDEKPFFEFNILEFRDRDVQELKKFCKQAFDLDNILTTANELKYTRGIQQKLSEWISNPSEEFVRLVAADFLGNKRFTQAIKEQFHALTKRAFEQLINERLTKRLMGAIANDSEKNMQTSSEENVQQEDLQSDNKIITTQEEVEGFYAVRVMLRTIVSPSRITMRDAQTYCAILLDNNNRKPLCRLRFNNTKNLKIGIFNENKEETVYSLNSVEDVFNFEEILKKMATAYLMEA